MQLKLSAIIFINLLASAAFGTAGNEKPTLSVTRKDSSGVYLVKYLDSKPGKVTVTITDSQGTLLVKRLIQNETGFVMPVNLSSVGQGIYTVYTDNGTEKQNIAINYNNDTAPTYSRIVNLGNDRYLFTTTHVGKETVTITIYDGNDAQVFQENQKVDGVFTMIFNLRDVPGKPSFEVSETSGHSLMVPGNPVLAVIDKTKKLKK